MPAPLSNDLRNRIIEARKNGDTIKKIAKDKGVSDSTVEKLLSLYRETGSYMPRPLNNGRPPKLTMEHLDQIRKEISEQPDITLDELIEKLSLPVCASALCRTINNKLGLRRKKNDARGRTKS